MNFMRQTVGLLLLCFLFVVSPAYSQDRWKFEIMPYAWFAGVDADVTVGGQKASVDLGPDELFDALDLAGSLLTTVQYNRFIFWAQLDYFSFDSNELDSSQSLRRLESDMFFSAVAAGWQFDGFYPGSTVDVLGGVRYLNMENTAEFAGIERQTRDENIIDGIFVLRPSFPLWRSLRLNPTFSIGAGDSDLTYELQPQLQFHVTDVLAARVGYRRLFYDVETSSTRAFDGTLQGLFAGIGFEF